MEKIAAFIEKHIAPIANALGMNRYVVAIQNAFLTLVPFMTIGSFALIITSPPVDYTTMEPGFGQAFFQGWQALADVTMLPLTIVNNATMGVLSIWAAIGLSFFLARHYKMTSFLPVALGVAAFLEMAAIDIEGSLSTEYFGGTGLFAAILISFLSVEFYRFLSDRKIGYIDLSGQGIPPALSDSIGNLVPAAIVLVVFGVLSGVVINLTGAPFPSLISLVMAPLVGVLDSGPGVFVLATIVMVLWWFGIHDSVITSPLFAFLTPSLAANMAAYAAGTAVTDLPNILVEPFWWTFMMIGGSGATFGLAFCALFSKSKQLRTVGKLGIVPAFFNINEPVIFGMPIMFNPTLFLPFVICPVLNGVVAYAAMALGIVGRCFVYPSWNMFCPIAAILSTMDWKAVVLCVGLIVIDVLIYLPFFKAYEKKKIAEEQLADAATETQEA